MEDDGKAFGATDPMDWLDILARLCVFSQRTCYYNTMIPELMDDVFTLMLWPMKSEDNVRLEGILSVHLIETRIQSRKSRSISACNNIH